MSDLGASRMKRAQSIYRGQPGDVKMEMGRLPGFNGGTRHVFFFNLPV